MTSSPIHRAVSASLLLALPMLFFGCDTSKHQTDSALVPAHPFADRTIPPSGMDPAQLPPPIKISGIGGSARGTAQPVVIDSRRFVPQVAERPPWIGEQIRPGSILPAHSRNKTLINGAPNNLSSGTLTDRPRVGAGTVACFPGITSTPWTPPDPTIGVGPNHVLETVNMEIAWYLKDGTPQFQQRLDSSGEPGFLEEVGAGGFTFDPKCFFDPLRERYVVLALERYDDESWLTLAVSDDDDPNGIWYKYRTNSLVDIDGTTYWVDYPGFGYDETGWYTTNNLFRDVGDGPGFAGTLLRTFDPAGALVGETLDFTDLLIPSASHQVAQVPDFDAPAIVVRSGDSTSIELLYINDPLGTPSALTKAVSVPEYSSANDRPPTPSGGELNPIDRRILNVIVRNGSLWAGHSVSTPEDARTVARWYEIDLDKWPSDQFGKPVLVQAGEIRPNELAHTCFPAIAVSGSGNAAVVYTSSSQFELPTLKVAGRVPDDPAGTLGASVVLATSNAVPESGTTYRWGDYFDATMDPEDDGLYWTVGEIYTPEGWRTEIGSFRIELIGDINGDGEVNGADLATLLANWLSDNPDCDLDGSGTVNGADLATLLANWG
ncbi:MAG: hypothetical protein CBC35_02545 [Planctomycetes bacterium TMED75]|nr:hypothetical protein [Planctomycetaceae bacterium]OUU95743.1 MAG: hypothetical protein CBC35_02545 [Planctomycetes bacterium TMED75]